MDMQVYDREARRISAQMRADGILPDRRREHACDAHLCACNWTITVGCIVLAVLLVAYMVWGYPA